MSEYNEMRPPAEIRAKIVQLQPWADMHRVDEMQRIIALKWVLKEGEEI